MNHPSLPAVAALAVFVFSLPGNVSGQQSSSSKSYLLSSTSLASGGTTKSTTYSLESAQGEGVVAPECRSAKYVLTGGFHATTDVNIAGQPWLTAVRPLITTMRGQDKVTLFGVGMNLGPTPTVKVAGQSVVVGARTGQTIGVTLPVQLSPGWQPVEVSNSAGTTVLTRGIGVLPMMYTVHAPASLIPATLVLKGTKGDMVTIAVGFGEVAPVSFAGVHFGLAVNPAILIVLAGFNISAADGELRLSFPPAKYMTGTANLQSMFVSSNPGYAPAAFCNVIRL